SEKENDELRLCLTTAPDEDKEVDYEILDKKYPIIEWKTEYLGTKPQFDETKILEEINLNVVIRSNGQRRYFSTLIYQDEIPEGVHTLMTEAGLVIHMLVEKKYPLRKKVLLKMLELKLESEEDSTMALELIRFVKKLIVLMEMRRIFECWFQNHTTNGHQFTMLNRHKNWLVHKQTACGKDFSNPFMVDNLPKIVGFSTHLASW
ncbi:hypothetical protein Tco_0617215, partial [Tanacetum coccineum]